MATLAGLRATIVWTVAPVTSIGSAQSTWIGIFGRQDPAARLSFEIAQVGWKQIYGAQPRVFWESGTDIHHFSVHYGAAVSAATPLAVELDRTSSGLYTFWANGMPLGQVVLGWAPRYVNVVAETQHPSDMVAGSTTSPEIITAVQAKIGDQWFPLKGDTFSTDGRYAVNSAPNGTLRIWDWRN